MAMFSDGDTKERVSFPSGDNGKEVTRQCRRRKRPGSIPGCGRAPGGGHGNPLQYSCLETPRDRGASQGQRSLWATVHTVAESRSRLKRVSMVSMHARKELWLNEVTRQGRGGAGSHSLPESTGRPCGSGGTGSAATWILDFQPPAL